MDEILPRPLVALVNGRPALPRSNRFLLIVRDLLLRTVRRNLLRTGSVLEREAKHLALADRNARTRRAVRYLPLYGRGQEQYGSSTVAQQPPVCRSKEGMDNPVLRAWRVLDLDLHLPLDAAHLPQERVRSVRAEVVPAFVRAHREGISQDRFTPVGLEPRLQHQCPWYILPRHPRLTRGADRPVARLIIQQAAEDCR